MRSVFRRDREGWTPAIIALILLLIAAFFVSLLSPPTIPLTLGVTLTRSPDPSNWTLTFVSVPTGISQNATTLTLYAYTGITVLNATTLYHLEGSGLNGVVYQPYQTGPTNTDASAGDRIFVLVSQYPAGTQWALAYAGTILSSGVFQ